jgi:hypothetical protein
MINLLIDFEYLPANQENGSNSGQANRNEMSSVGNSAVAKVDANQKSMRIFV